MGALQAYTPERLKKGQENVPHCVASRLLPVLTVFEHRQLAELARLRRVPSIFVLVFEALPVFGGKPGSEDFIRNDAIPRVWTRTMLRRCETYPGTNMATADLQLSNLPSLAPQSCVLRRTSYVAPPHSPCKLYAAIRGAIGWGLLRACDGSPRRRSLDTGID